MIELRSKLVALMNQQTNESHRETIGEAIDEIDRLWKENAELKIDREVMTKIIKIAVPYAVESLKYANSPQRHKVQADLRRIREMLELSSD